MSDDELCPVCRGTRLRGGVECSACDDGEAPSRVRGALAAARYSIEQARLRLDLPEPDEERRK